MDRTQMAYLMEQLRREIAGLALPTVPLVAALLSVDGHLPAVMQDWFAAHLHAALRVQPSAAVTDL